MGIFGDKCIRCKTRTYSKSAEGAPTCEECLLQLQADREVKRKCLIDGTEMGKLIVLNIVIDCCPKCGGVWLDPDELEVIEEVLKNEGSGDFAVGMFMGMAIG